MSRRRPEDEVKDLDEGMESWQNARQYAALVGEIPSSFTSITRSLVTDGCKGNGELSQGTRFLITRLLKGKAILAPFFHMSKDLYPDEFENRIYISPAEMVELYKPFDMAAFVTVVFLSKKLAAACPSTDWQYISATLQKPADMGLEIGLNIPAIGIGTGLLASVMAQLGLGVFLLHDPKGFTDYRRKLKGSTHRLDHEWESSRWGCTSAHVAAIFIQMFGLGVSAAHAFLRGALQTNEGLGSETDNEVYRYKIARIWLDSLYDEGKIPNITHRGRFYPEGGDVNRLMERVASIRQSSGEDGWLTKNKDSVSPELTPMLFRVASPKPAATARPGHEDEEGEDIFADDDLEPS